MNHFFQTQTILGVKKGNYSVIHIDALLVLTEVGMKVEVETVSVNSTEICLKSGNH